MQLEDRDIQQYTDAHPTLHDLLKSAAATAGAQRVCLVTPGADDECFVLVDSSEQASSDHEIYKSRETDLSVHVYYRGKSLGNLVFADPTLDVPQSVLDSYASAAGFVMGYAADLEDAAHSVEESRVLRELGLQLGEPTDLEHLLENTARSVRQLLKADYAAVATIAHDGTSRWITMVGNRTDLYRHTVFPAGKGTAARAAAAKEVVIVDNLPEQDNAQSEFPVHVAEGGVTALAVPILKGGTALGAIIVGSRRPRIWDQAEIQLAAVLGTGAGVAIDQVKQSSIERSQRAFFEKVLDNFPGVMVVLSPFDLRVVRSNTNFTRLLGEPYHSGEPIVGHTLRELSSQEWDERSEQVAQMLQHVAATGEAVSFQQYASANPGSGATSYWNWTAAPIESLGEGEQHLVMLIAQDVTDIVMAQRKEQESIEAARARAEELETVIRQMVDGVIIFDANHRIVKYNPASELLLGRKIEIGVEADLPSMFGLHTLANELYSSDQLPVAYALRGEPVAGAQLVIKRPSGDDVIVSVSAAPLSSPDGTITGAVVVMRDITEDKLAERLKDEFLSVVSHELRTPLSAIMGYSDLMLRGVHGVLAERQVKALGAVRSNADRLLHLINDLLDVSRLETGTIPLTVRPVNAADIVSRTIAQTRVLASNAGVSIDNRIPRDSNPMVMADESRLQQILENLLTNAIKFTPSGGSVVFSASASSLSADDPQALEAASPVAEGSEPRSLVITVSDTGAGLESDQLSRIWERFYQVDTSAKRKSGGAGLGLSIVQNLVELHGGHIQAQSEGTSRGTSFKFSLPSAPAHWPSSTDQKKARKLSDRPYVEDDTNDQVVLVVEDDEDQREIICDMLEMEGYKVVVAEDGEEALSIASLIIPSAIALDVMLPRSDGWEVLSSLKRNPSTKEIPVLIISVVDQQEFGKKLGADGYLIKPLEARTLRAAVRRLIKEER